MLSQGNLHMWLPTKQRFDGKLLFAFSYHFPDFGFLVGKFFFWLVKV